MVRPPCDQARTRGGGWVSANAGRGAALLTLAAGLWASAASGQGVRLLDRPPDPHATPRPYRGARDVPTATSLYLELAVTPGGNSDAVAPESVAVRLGAEVGPARDLLGPGRRFAEGVSGWLRPTADLQGNAALAVYLEPGPVLRPFTTYEVRVTARSRAGRTLREAGGGWTFTTGAAPAVHALTFPLDLSAEPVRWHGAFFSGFGNIRFCTDAATFGPTYDRMAEARKDHPRAWSLQRDFWMTGSEDRPPGFVSHALPNVVRERETRRVAAIEPAGGGVLLRLEDLFGGAQYGIAPGRPVSADYHPGDEVLIADGLNDARARVIEADDAAGTVRVGPVATPPGGWKIAYEGPLPAREDPDAPGLFPPGGCYLRKFRPHGTPCYFWGRLDKEWDLAHRRYGRRLLPNFADAPGDLARDGRSWTTAKDLAEWHDVVRTITGHVVDRYGAAATDFVWSVFNEPDLGPLFWRADWDELQRFYDVTTDAVLRAFEDRGHDSAKVFIGGLELGGIFGANLRIREFLAHCSPRAAAAGALPLNAAVADRRLDGKRSRRVESLCRAHGGKGSPCDFVSVHSYNRSEMMAAKLARAKEVALEVDPEYYRALRVNSHESCPDWMPPPDEAAADSYLGNGYFPTWCLDVARRQLRRAAGDPRFGYGETILTVWPPNQNFAGLNAVTRVLHADGDGRADRRVTVPMPVFHALNWLSDMGDHYRVLPDRAVDGHVVSGFASGGPGAVRVALYAHHAQDTQARSGAEFAVTLDLAGLAGRAFRVREYRIDTDHNSYFRPGRALRGRVGPGEADAAKVDAAVRALDAGDPAAQREALRGLGALGPSAVAAWPAVARLSTGAKDESLRAAAKAAAERIFAPRAYPRLDVERVEALAVFRPTATSTHPVGPDGRLRITVRVAGNGLNYLEIAGEEPSR